MRLAPDPVLAFLNGWTRKEAYLKALGLGLTAPLMDPAKWSWAMADTVTWPTVRRRSK